MSGGVTIVKVGGNQSPTNSNITRTTQTDSNGRNSRLFFQNDLSFYLNAIYKSLYFKNNVIFFNSIVITPKPRLMADSRSTGRLQSSNAHRSMTRLNAGKTKNKIIIDIMKMYLLFKICKDNID